MRQMQSREHISTHALTEGDGVSWEQLRTGHISTHALTEGDIADIDYIVFKDISTHALTEGDAMQMIQAAMSIHFNSRPHGGRPRCAGYEIHDNSFQLTPSRRATMPRIDTMESIAISTHALTEGDAVDIYVYDVTDISTHALTEGDTDRRDQVLSEVHFNSRPHGGRRQI